MNNEPVAYLMVERNDGNSYIQMGVPTRDEKISHQPYPLYTHPVKELTREDRSKLIGTLKWAEDLLRVAGHDEAREDAFELVKVILRKAQEK